MTALRAKIAGEEWPRVGADPSAAAVLWDGDYETPGERKWELIGGDEDAVAAVVAARLPQPRR